MALLTPRSDTRTQRRRQRPSAGHDHLAVLREEVVPRAHATTGVRGDVHDAQGAVRSLLCVAVVVLTDGAWWQADFGLVLPRISLLATIGLAYSVLSPIINGLAMLSFLLFFVSWKFCAWIRASVRR